MFTDFVIARSDEAQAIGRLAVPATRWPTLEAKGVDPVKLGTLYCLANGSAYKPAVIREFPLVGGNESDGPWVLEFSSKVLNAIASIRDDEVPAVASKWAATEELKADRWSVSLAEQFVGKLKAHAVRAISERSSLFLRLAL